MIYDLEIPVEKMYNNSKINFKKRLKSNQRGTRGILIKNIIETHNK